VAAAAGCTKKVDLEPVRDAVRAADQGWLKATATDNLPAFLAYVSTSASMLPPNEPAVTGTDAIRTWASRMFATPGFSVRWKATVVDVAASADLGYTRGSYEMRMPGPNGLTLDDSGKYVTIWRLESDGKWRVVVDIFNSNSSVPGLSPADTTAAPTD
jgi:ketosteroid isomerase-like protein